MRVQSLSPERTRQHPPTVLSVCFAQLWRKLCGSSRGAPRSWPWRGTGRWRAMPYSPRRSRGPTRIPMTMKKRERSYPLSMTSTERGSRSGFGEAGSKLPLEKNFSRIPFCLLSHMFKRRDNALLQGSWKQSCIVIGASIIWFLRKKPTCVNFRIWNRPVL